MDLLPSTMKLGQGYIFTGICYSVHRGVVSQHTLQQVSRGVGVLSQHALQVVSKHALQQVSRGGACSWGVCSLGICSQGVPCGDPPGTATAAGMHSCLYCISKILSILQNSITWFCACAFRYIYLCALIICYWTSIQVLWFWISIFLTII